MAAGAWSEVRGGDGEVSRDTSVCCLCAKNVLMCILWQDDHEHRAAI